ncbi:MAG: HAD family hydrolase [Microgenomates group bacterium]
MKLSGIKAVGFDVDGTLYHAPDSVNLEFGKILINKIAHELARDPDEIAEEYLAKREQFRSNTLTINSYGLDGQKIFQDVWDEVAVENYMKKDARLVALMDSLKGKYRLFLISNGTGRQIERKLTALGLDYHDFDPRIYCYDQGWIKPDPQPFLAAIEGLNLKPEEIVYIGDREDVDIEGAKATGMKTIMVGGESALSYASCQVVYDIGLLLI